VDSAGADGWFSGVVPTLPRNCVTLVDMVSNVALIVTLACRRVAGACCRPAA